MRGKLQLRKKLRKRKKQLEIQFDSVVEPQTELQSRKTTMPLPTYQSIADRAAAAGVELKDLCADAGVAASSLWRWKTGKTDPLRTVRNIEDALRRYEGQ
jgi:hypothetical protein